jgi:hypothetical protein
MCTMFTYMKKTWDMYENSKNITSRSNARAFSYSTQWPAYNYYSASCSPMYYSTRLSQGRSHDPHQAMNVQQHLNSCSRYLNQPHDVQSINYKYGSTKQDSYRLLPSSRKVSSVPGGQSLSCNRHVLCIRSKNMQQATRCQLVWLPGYTRLWSVGLINTMVRFHAWTVEVKLVTRRFQTVLK